MVTKSKSNKPKLKKSDVLRHAEYYDMQDTYDKLYADSLEGKTFNKLMDQILSRENILLAYRNIKGNNGNCTPGVDGLTIKDVEILTPVRLVEKLRNIVKNYRPRAVRRKEIPKPNGNTRPLGIPCIWDRLVQQCILQVLEPICEARFSDNSYGFRPNRSCENAVAHAERLAQRSNLHYVVEVDIKSFFDEVNHSKLVKQMWSLGIRDSKLIYIIKQILKAQIRMPDGSLETPVKGTPQGGILSPLLANIVLNELDRWVESQWQENPVAYKYSLWTAADGRVAKSNGYTAMKKTNLKEMYIVRYADDFRIFCRTKDAATRTMAAVTQWLNERLRLQVSPEKTRVVNLKRQYSEFLGIKIKVHPKGKKYVVESHVSDKALKRIAVEAKGKIKTIAKPKGLTNEAEAILKWNAFVMGVHNYYCMATHVSRDFRKIAYPIGKSVKARLGKKIKRESECRKENVVRKRYGKSGQIRYMAGSPIAPIGYVQTKNPMGKKRTVQKYTPEGREEIHRNLGVNRHLMLELMRQPLYDRSVQFADNRIALYCGQNGKCAITGKAFKDTGKIHCHHILPREMNGTDDYSNLTLILVDVHILIHATTQETIGHYLSVLNLSDEQLNKVNALRERAGNNPVVVQTTTA